MRLKFVPLTKLWQTSIRPGDAEASDRERVREIIDSLRFEYPAARFPYELTKVTLTPTCVKSLMPGVHAIVGGTSSGKTELGRYLQRNNPTAVRLAYEEPEKRAIVGEPNLALKIAEAIEGGSKLIIIDSLRTLGYKQTGTTGKGGLDMGLFTWLTIVDIWAKELGILIFPLFNPIAIDEELKNQLREATAGAMESAIIVARPSLELTTRSDPGREYERVDFRLSKRDLNQGQDAATVFGSNENAIAPVSIEERLIELSFPRLTQN